MKFSAALAAVAVSVSMLAAQGVLGGLSVTTDGTDYTVTAPDLWEMKIKAASGCIWSFKDLTDDSGGTFNYMAQDAYNFNRSLILFGGRGNTAPVLAFCGNDADAWADRYSFGPVGTDLSSYTITYTEAADDGIDTYVYGGLYTDGAATVSNGNVLTSIRLTINAPGAEETVIDWAVTNFGQKTSGDLLSAKYFLNNYAGPRIYWADGRTQAGGYGDGMDTIRTIEDDSEWGEAEIADTLLNTVTNGITPGRKFRLERTSGGIGTVQNGGTDSVLGMARMSFAAGNTWCTYVPASNPGGQSYNWWWANIDGIQVQDASRYSPPLPGDFVKPQAGYVSINLGTGGTEDRGGVLLVR
jgi:hypothetical protein